MNLTSINKLYLWGAQCLIFIAVLLFLVINKPVSINANLTSLFSESTHNNWQAIQQKINSQANTTQIYLIGHANLEQAKQASNAFIEQAKTIADIDSVTGKLSNIPNQSTMIQSYKGFEQQVLSPQFRTALENKDLDKIFKIEFELINQIGDQLVAQTLEKNPTLSFADFLNRSPFPQNKINISNDGYLTVTHNHLIYILVTINTKEGALNVNKAKAIVSALNDIPLNPEVEYVRTGGIFYSDEASSSAQSEMQVLGGLSLIATLFLIFISYRRVSVVIATLFLISVSILYGFIGLNIFFDEVNLLTMVFAITLIGIAVDYSFHSFTELQNISPEQASPLTKIRMSLVLSFITTTLGYLLLLIVPFVIFKQIAVFTVFGLLGALLTVLLVFPYLHKKLNFSRAKPAIFYHKVNQFHQKLLNKNKASIIVFCALVLLCIASLVNINFLDNPKSFYRVSDHLADNEEKVKSILGQKFDNQYLLVKGETPQDLLENEEQILPLLKRLQGNNVVGSYQAISQWLPSVKQQKLDNKLLVNAAENQYFNSFSSLLGLNANNVQPAKQYLTPSAWFETQLGKTFKHKWLEDDGGYYSIVRFSNITDVKALSDALTSLSGNEVTDNSIFVDTLADTERELSLFREVLLLVFAVAFATAFVVFTFRYGWRRACVGALVPVIAFTVALAISQLSQGYVNLFNVAAGLVILALGLDYSVFYAEHGFSPSITQTTLMSALSSIFVFAMLGFSSTPAISNFGQTVFIGIVFTFLFAPMMTKTVTKLSATKPATTLRKIRKND